MIFSLNMNQFDTASDILPSPEPLLNFSDILLKNNKGKNKAAKKIRQKYKNKIKKVKIKLES